MFITEQQDLSEMSKEFFNAMDDQIPPPFTNFAAFMDCVRAFCGL